MDVPAECLHHVRVWNDFEKKKIRLSQAPNAGEHTPTRGARLPRHAGEWLLAVFALIVIAAPRTANESKFKYNKITTRKGIYFDGFLPTIYGCGPRAYKIKTEKLKCSLYDLRRLHVTLQRRHCSL